VRVSAPNGIGFGTSKSTPSAETAETLLRGGFGIGFGTYLGTFIENRFRHQTALVSAQEMPSTLSAGEALLGKPVGNSVVELEPQLGSRHALI